ncbi:dihydrolipoamide acetyltransferase family protein [Pseudonocardia sp. RS010]|uniref:dihydrolipoamide acetyltransferase family protein n=1 Tax=Pseudonocardia sp. RS010 TaxID=3385979 RepID=UPI0039A235BA
MSQVIRLPEVLTGMAEATLTGWHVQVGDEVRPGEPLADIETDKASVEYVADAGGVLAEYLVELSNPVPVGTPIALLATDGETVEQARAAAGHAPAGHGTGSRTETGTQAGSQAGPQIEAGSGSRASGSGSPSSNGSSPADDLRPLRLRASPLVRRLARDRGLDLSVVAGSGPAGRIVRRDLERLDREGPAPAPAAAPAPAEQVPAEQVPAEQVPAEQVPEPAARQVFPPAGVEAVPHSGMRRAIARRLTESKTTIPHFYLSADVRVDALLALRRQVNQTLDERVSVNDLVVKAVAGALQEVPELNAVWTPDAVLQHTTVDVAVAVALDDGLVTPVVRDVAGRSLTALARDLRDLAARARSRALAQDELEGGAFAVSNLGMYGIDQATAIINPPHAGILAVGAATRRPVVDGDEVAVGTVMTVSLSADHRVVDGATAARWLTAFVQRVENPLRILA